MKIKYIIFVLLLFVPLVFVDSSSVSVGFGFDLWGWLTEGGSAGDFISTEVSTYSEESWTDASGVIRTIERIRNWLYAIFFVCATICFLVSAFYFITSEGDPGKVQKAKDMLKYGVIGVIVALFSGGMVQIISGILLD